MAWGFRYLVGAICIMFAVGVADSGTADALDVIKHPLPEGWSPAGELYWVSPGTMGVMARRSDQGQVSYGFLTIDPAGKVDVDMALSDRTHCRDLDGSLLFLQNAATGKAVRRTPNGDVTPLADVAEITACRGRLALANTRFRDRLGRQTVLATDGTRYVGVVAAGEAASEIILYTESDILARWTVEADLWRDPLFAEVRDQGGFMIYAHIGAGRQKELADQGRITGLPVFVVTPEGDLQTPDVPWPGWEKVGAYTLAETRSGWVIAATNRRDDSMDGLYRLDSGLWQHVRQTDILPETLRVGPEGCDAIWLERDHDAPRGTLRGIAKANLCLPDH